MMSVDRFRRLGLSKNSLRRKRCGNFKCGYAFQDSSLPTFLELHSELICDNDPTLHCFETAQALFDCVGIPGTVEVEPYVGVYEKEPFTRRHIYSLKSVADIHLHPVFLLGKPALPPRPPTRPNAGPRPA